MSWVLVLVGGMVGAPLRYLTDRFVQSRHDGTFPWGTLTVNLCGAFLLGLLTGLAPTHELKLLLGTGLCGALTTYSTFSYETLRLAEQRARTLAVANAGASMLVGLGAALLGLDCAGL